MNCSVTEQIAKVALKIRSDEFKIIKGKRAKVIRVVLGNSVGMPLRVLPISVMSILDIVLLLHRVRVTRKANAKMVVFKREWKLSTHD